MIDQSEVPMINDFMLYDTIATEKGKVYILMQDFLKKKSFRVSYNQIENRKMYRRRKLFFLEFMKAKCNNFSTQNAVVTSKNKRMKFFLSVYIILCSLLFSS